MEYPFNKAQLVSNFAAFQVGWFACAYWHDSRSAVVLGLLIAWLYQSEAWSRVRIQVTLQVALIGMLVDSALTWFGVLQFDNGLPLIPIWHYGLWILFASSVTISLRWIMAKPIFAIVGGAVFGPLAYIGGMQFGALQVEGWVNYAIMATTWGAMMLLFSFIVNAQPNHRMVRQKATN